MSCTRAATAFTSGSSFVLVFNDDGIVLNYEGIGGIGPWTLDLAAPYDCMATCVLTLTDGNTATIYPNG